MTRARVWWAVALALTLTVRMAWGQKGDSTFALAVQAYDTLDFHLASMLLRRVVAAAPRGRAPKEVEPALTYLRASEWFDGLRDSATPVFRTLVILDPRYRPNPRLAAQSRGVRTSPHRGSDALLGHNFPKRDPVKATARRANSLR